MNKLKFLTTSAIILIGALCTPTSATIIDFENAYTGNALKGYEGFTWENMYGYPGTYMPGTGYFNGITSGTNIAFNGDANVGEGAKPGSFWTTDGGIFSLQSINVTKAWQAGTTRFIGYIDGSPILIKDVYASTLGPTHAVFGWHGLTRVDIVDLDKSLQSVVDDIRVNELPEPPLSVIMIVGFAAMCLGYRGKLKPAEQRKL